MLRSKCLREKVAVYLPQPMFPSDEPLLPNPDAMLCSSPTLNATRLLTRIRINFVVRSVHGRGGLTHLSTVLAWLQVWGQEWRLGNGLILPWLDFLLS